jgi:uncharacterized membrane protein
MFNDAPSTTPGLLKINRLLILTLVFMAIGTLVELILIDHYEDTWQLIPIILIAVSILLFIILKWRSSKSAINIFRSLMLLCMVSGLLGTWLHLNANMEFEAELHSSASNWSVFTNSLSGALPTLAPGSMIVFGLIGYSQTLLTLKQQK